MRPGEGAIEDVNWRLLYFLGLHDLYAKNPCWEVTLLDLVEEVLDMVVRFGACQSLGSLAVHRLDTIFRSEVPFDIDEASVLILLVHANIS
jgi:hypothetical protein